MHGSNSDLPVALTIRELALCGNKYSICFNSVEMSQIIEQSCTI